MDSYVTFKIFICDPVRSVKLVGKQSNMFKTKLILIRYNAYCIRQWKPDSLLSMVMDWTAIAVAHVAICSSINGRLLSWAVNNSIP